MAGDVLELEKLLVRIIGDSTQYSATIQKAVAEAESAAKELEKTIDEMVMVQQMAFREAARAVASAIDPTKILTSASKQLKEAYEQGSITLATYLKSTRELKSALLDTSAGQSHLAKSMRDVEQIKQSMMTNDELVMQKMERVKQLYIDDALSADQFRRAVELLTKEFDANKAAAEALANEEKHAQEITQRHIPEMQRYRTALNAVHALYKSGKIDVREWRAEINRLESELTTVKTKTEQMSEQQDRANALTQAALGPYKRYAQLEKELTALLRKRLITQETMSRTLSKELQQLPNFIAAKKAQKEVEQEEADLKRRANQLLTNSLTPMQRYQKELAEIVALTKRGVITSAQFLMVKKALARQYSTFNAGLSKAGGLLQQFAGNLRSVGMSMSMYITAPITAFGASSVYAFAQFDQAMTKSLSIMEGVTDQQREMMGTQAISLSKDSIKTAKDLADGFYFLAAAGLTATEAMQALGTVERFAVAGAMEMETATDMLVQAQTGLGMRSKDATENMKNMTRTSDVLVHAANMSTATIKDFADAIRTKSGPALRLLNKDMEEGVAVLMAYANQGVVAENAGEQLHIMLRDLQSAYLRNTEAWKKEGIAVFKEGQMRPIANIIGDMEVHLMAMSDEERRATLMMLGLQDRSVAATASLIGMSKSIQEYETALRLAGGATDRIAKEQMKSFSNQVQLLWNRITAVRIEIGKMFAPVILRINQVIDYSVQAWNSLSEGIKKTILVAMGLLAVVGPVVAVFGTAVAVIAAVVAGIAALVTVGLPAIGVAAGIVAILAALTAAATATVVAIGALVFALMGVEGIEEAWNTAEEAIGKFFESSMGFLANFKFNMSQLKTWFESNWRLLVQDLIELNLVLLNNIIANLGIMLDVGLTIFNDWTQAVVDLITAPFNDDTFETVMTQFGQRIMNAVANGMERAHSPFEGFESQALASMEGIFAFDPNFAKITGGFAQIGNFLGTMSNKAGELKNVNINSIGDAWSLFGKKVVEVQNMLASPQQKATKEAFDELQKGITDLEVSLQKQVDTWGMSKTEVAIYELTLQGATDAELQHVFALDNEFEAMERSKKAREEVMSLIEKGITPMQKFEKEQKKLIDLWKADVINTQQFNDAFAVLRKDFEKEIDIKFTVSGLDAVKKGTAQAAQLIHQMRVDAAQREALDFKLGALGLPAIKENERGAFAERFGQQHFAPRQERDLGEERNARRNLLRNRGFARGTSKFGIDALGKLISEGVEGGLGLQPKKLQDQRPIVVIEPANLDNP